LKIYTESVKQRHVSHWDLDYLPSSEIEQRCPACAASVLPQQPACSQCGEQLYVEHPAAFPRDATAVHRDAFCKADERPCRR
jgi:hypothetical protein